MNTIIGLRGLLLRNQLYKKTKNRPIVTLMDKLPIIRNQSDDYLASKLIDTLKDMNINERNQIENERCLFLERFISLFMWPAIFSIEPPSEQLLDAELGIKNHEPIEMDNQQKRKRKIKEKIDIPGAKNEIKLRTKRVKLNANNDKQQASKGKERTATRTSNRIKKFNTRLKDTTAEIEENPTKAENNEILPKKSILVKNEPSQSNETDAESAEIPALQNQLKLRKIIKIVKVQNKDNQQIGISELPQNLRKVDKSEIENILKNKKQVKMFRIQKIQMKDGTIKTVSKPYDSKKLPVSLNMKDYQTTNTKGETISTLQNYSIKTNETIKKNLLGENPNVLDIVSLAKSVKKEFNISNPQVNFGKNQKYR
ncbi:hypothetical protein HHI36_019072 [Cryptolaemus montrouzieri]|uniref:Uncharacterized protein n=1 Tax=Cryptolaemus montrouzieri TaxID=559131 RepID=A0ABD2P2C5_9CUCU